MVLGREKCQSKKYVRLGEGFDRVHRSDPIRFSQATPRSSFSVTRWSRILPRGMALNEFGTHLVMPEPTQVAFFSSLLDPRHNTVVVLSDRLAQLAHQVVSYVVAQFAGIA